MKTKFATATTVLLCLFGQGQAATMTFNLSQLHSLFSTSGTGKLWVGNFGTNGGGGSLLTSSQVSSYVSASDWGTLFPLFRPATSFSISGGLVSGMTDDGLSTLLNVGTAINYTDEQGLQGYTPDTASQFAGQNLYLLATTSSAAGFEWFNFDLILLKPAANFGTGDNGDGPLNNLDYEFSNRGGNLLIGTQSGAATWPISTGVIAGVAVPEPSSASLMLLGAAGVFAMRRLRKTNL
jgi:hypothetical protein